jgi:hypothetical protein
MATPKTVGSGTGIASGLQEMPDGVTWSCTHTRIECVVTYQGTYANCKAAALTGGSLVPGTAGSGDYSGLVVEKAAPRKTKGARGLLTVTYKAESTGSGEESAPKYEVEWAQLEKSIETHPRYTEGKTLLGETISEGYSGLSLAAFAFVRAYFESDEARRKVMYEPLGLPDDEVDTSFAFGMVPYIQELIDKKLMGQDSYLLFAPVVRETIDIAGIPTTEGAGTVEAPPGAASAPSGYEYLLTADRRESEGPDGRWRRIREWTGSYVWDADIYPDTPVPEE